MKTESQVRQQLKQVVFRHRKKLLRGLFKQQPGTCAHNRRVDLDDDSAVYLCGVMTPAGTPRNIPCDSRIPGCTDMARECPLWDPPRSKVDVKHEFRTLISSGDRGRIALEYPDVAALMWVLDEAPPMSDDGEENEEDEEDEDMKGWWPPKWLIRLGGLR